MQRQTIAQLLEELGELPLKGMFIGDNNCAACESTGNIMIQSLETALFDDDFNDEVVSYEPEIDDLELEGEEKFRILEYFSNSQNLMLILDGSADPRLVPGVFGEYDGEVVTTVTAYFEHLLETLGDSRKSRLPGDDDDSDDD